MHSLCFSSAQITIDNCVEVERIAIDLLLEDVQQNIGENTALLNAYNMRMS